MWSFRRHLLAFFCKTLARISKVHSQSLVGRFQFEDCYFRVLGFQFGHRWTVLIHDDVFVPASHFRDFAGAFLPFYIQLYPSRMPTRQHRPHSEAQGAFEGKLVQND